MNDSFNLSPPPHFVGFDETKPVRIYHRHLPHWRQDGVSYAVTFRLADSLPREKLNELKRYREEWEITNVVPPDDSPLKAHARKVNRMIEKWLDKGFGACHFRDPVNATLACDTFFFYEGQLCRTPCMVVMPNHIHAIMIPHFGVELEKVLQSIKTWIAKQISKRNGTSGRLWAQESYDRIIRDEEHLYRVVQYIGRNGRSADLKPGEYLRWISPEWKAHGWDFEDE